MSNCIIADMGKTGYYKLTFAIDSNDSNRVFFSAFLLTTEFGYFYLNK